jgi:hypothetical protein
MKLNQEVLLSAAIVVASGLVCSAAIAAPVYRVDLSANSGTRNSSGPNFHDSRTSAAGGVSLSGGSDVAEIITGIRPVYSIGNSSVLGSAGPGLLSLWAWASASTDAVQQPSTGFSSASASGFLRDAFTILCSTCAIGSRGTMRFAISLDGSVDGSGRRVSTVPGGGFSSSSSWNTTFGLTTGYGNAGGSGGGTYSGTQDGYTGTATGLGIGLHTFTLDFAFGQPIDLQWQSNISTSGRATSTGHEPHFMAEVESIADFASTFAWAGILTVLDQYGAPVSAFTAFNELGVSYANSFATAVPEPNSVTLLLMGLLLLAFAMLTNRRSGGRSPQADLAVS